MKNILFYHHATADNHGCEALIRTIASMNEEALGECEFSITSRHPEVDAKFLDDNNKYKFIKPDNFKILNSSRAYYYVGMFSRFFHCIPFKKRVLKDAINAAKKADLCVSIGGDNYSYGRSASFITIDKYVKKACNKTVLWGCSINPEMLKGRKYAYKVKGLRKFSLITARESMTYDALKELGFDNVKLYPDPAFTLPVGEVKEPMFDNGKDIVGINISPLIRSYETGSDITVKCYTAMVRHILENTDFNVAFISHVRSKTNDDSEAASAVMESFKGEERIKLFDQGNCMDLKGYISKCRFFVVARTHASIAAYSTCVPTVVVGYSVKARGIAKDLFGTDENFVIPVQSLKEENTLVEAFEWLRDNEKDIKERLTEIMPGYIEKAKGIEGEIKALLEN